MSRVRALLGGARSLGLAMLTSAPAVAEEQETVVVQGSRAPGVVAEPEVSVGVIRGEPLREPGADAADVLSRAPGVQVSRAGTSADLVTVSIRGSEASQVPVYLAGIRLNDDVVGVTDLSRIPLWMMDRAEVYRGSTPTALGRSGMSGALVFEPTLPQHAEYRLGSMAGSYGAGALWFGGTLKHLSDDPRSTWVTSLSAKRAGARNNFRFTSDDGTAFVSEDDESQVRVNADYLEDDAWVITRGRLPVGQKSASIVGLYNRFSRDQGVSGLSLVPATASRAALRRDLVGLSTRVPCNWGEACSLALTSGVNLTRLVTSDPDGELSLGAFEVDQRSHRISQDANLGVEVSERWQTSVGVTLESSQLLLDAPDLLLARATERYFGARSSVKFTPTRDRFVRLVGRASCVDTEGIDAGSGPAGAGELSWTQCHPEGRIGARQEIGDSMAVRAVVHRGVRFPTVGERFGVTATTRGNTDLKVEKALSLDVGASLEPKPQSWGSFWLDAALFARHTRDLVAFRRSSLGYVRPFNVGEARFFGGELSGEWSALHHVRSQSSLALLDPRDVTKGRTADNSLVPFRSQITATEELEVYRATPADPLSHLGLTGYLTYRSGRVADPAGLIVIPQQVVIDLAIRAQFIEQLDVRARVENLLGFSRYDALGFPLPGRSYFLSAELTGRPSL